MEHSLGMTHCGTGREGSGEARQGEALLPLLSTRQGGRAGQAAEQLPLHVAKLSEVVGCGEATRGAA